jgi:hypothetical protein
MTKKAGSTDCFGECLYMKTSSMVWKLGSSTCDDPANCVCPSPPGSAEGSVGETRFIPCIPRGISPDGDRKKSP